MPSPTVSETYIADATSVLGTLTAYNDKLTEMLRTPFKIFNISHQIKSKDLLIDGEDLPIFKTSAAIVKDLNKAESDQMVDLMDKLRAAQIDLRWNTKALERRLERFELTYW